MWISIWSGRSLASGLFRSTVKKPWMPRGGPPPHTKKLLVVSTSPFLLVSSSSIWPPHGLMLKPDMMNHIVNDNDDDDGPPFFLFPTSFGLHDFYTPLLTLGWEEKVVLMIGGVGRYLHPPCCVCVYLCVLSFSYHFPPLSLNSGGGGGRRGREKDGASLRFMRAAAAAPGCSSWLPPSSFPSPDPMYEDISFWGFRFWWGGGGGWRLSLIVHQGS